MWVVILCIMATNYTNTLFKNLQKILCFDFTEVDYFFAYMMINNFYLYLGARSGVFLLKRYTIAHNETSLDGLLKWLALIINFDVS